MCPSISIVIPTYQRPILLKRCLDLLVMQTFPTCRYEIIVVSDGRDSTTKNMIESNYKDSNNNPLIKFIELQSKKGPAAARNEGWKSATGQLIVFTDDDCVPCIYWLQALWAAFPYEQFWAGSGKIIVPLPSRPTDYEKNIARMETASFITANCCCTKEALELVNGFDERFLVAWREDTDLEFNLKRQGIPIKKIPDAIVVHPVRKAPWGISLKEQKKTMYNVLLYKKFPEFYKKMVQSHPPWHYYIMILTFILFWVDWLLFPITGILLFLGGIWLITFSRFAYRRLKGNTRRLEHVFEIILTSSIIPFLSVFWRLYGSFKFRVPFL